MSALYEAVRSALASRKRSKSRVRALVAVELEVDADVERLVALAPAPGEAGTFDAAVVWDSRGSETLDGELIVGLGAAVATTQGDDPAADVARALAAVEDGAPVRAFGGVAFEWAGGSRSTPREPFGRFTFVVPRWTFFAGANGRARLVVTTRLDGKEPDPRLAVEAAEIEAALTNGRRAPAVEEPAARVVDDGAVPFVTLCEQAIAAIADGNLEKVVVARRALLKGAAPPAHVLARLAGNAGCVRFGLATPSGAFVGATPEVLVACDERGIRTEAVAGSEPRRGADLSEVSLLLVREKDRREHAFVLDAIRAALEGQGATVTAEREPHVRSLTHVHHLVTSISASASARAHALELAIALHPTPAMGGVPRAAAEAFLRRYETFARGLYASPFGWVDAAGHGAFVVGIRSALLLPREAWAYAGVGVVRGSVTSVELAETNAKLRTMLEALGAPEPQRERRLGARARSREADA